MAGMVVVLPLGNVASRARPRIRTREMQNRPTPPIAGEERNRRRPASWTRGRRVQVTQRGHLEHPAATGLRRSQNGKGAGIEAGFDDVQSAQGSAATGPGTQESARMPGRIRKGIDGIVNGRAPGLAATPGQAPTGAARAGPAPAVPRPPVLRLRSRLWPGLWSRLRPGSFALRLTTPIPILVTPIIQNRLHAGIRHDRGHESTPTTARPATSRPNTSHPTTSHPAPKPMPPPALKR